VAALDYEEGGLSPGGIGFDINCGVRLLRTNLTVEQIRSKLKELLESIFHNVPSGVGEVGKIKLSFSELDEVLVNGARWAVEHGYGTEKDLEHLEENGCMKGANPSKVSNEARKRGAPQLGTLGAGNHFLEIQKVDKIYLPEIAKVFGIEKEGQVCVMIHCLPENSKILTELGYTIDIKELVEKRRGEKLIVFNHSQKRVEKAKVSHFWEFKNNKEMYEIITLTGKKIACTNDHPIFTPSGWKKAEELKENDLVSVCPFDGVEYEAPTDIVIVSEKDFVKNGGTERMVKNLKKKRLLPLKLSNPFIGIFARLVGYAFGDSWVGGKRPTVKFTDRIEVLKRIKEDLNTLGFKSTLVKVRPETSKIEYTKGKTCFIDLEREAYQLVVTSPSFAILLKSLSVPFGRKTDVEFDVPEWIKKVPKWIKRLFLAGYFGAEMCRIKSSPAEPYRVYSPKVSLNKVEDLVQNGVKFMQSIQELLKEFEVESAIMVFPYVKRKDGKISYKILLQLSNKLENMINFSSKIGCEYHVEKFSSFIKALHYYRYKKKMIEKEAEIQEKDFKTVAITPYIFKQLQVLAFKEFVERYSVGDLVMWDVVEKIRRAEKIERVYDITMAHDAHNFIADGFVVSNTGSRGFGHQVCTDYLRILESRFRDELRKLPDRELVYAPAGTKECEDYFSAMACAANYAWTNRSMIMHWVRESFVKVLGMKLEEIGLEVIYDVAHNICKVEEHEIDGKKVKVFVHRKGATRAFPPGHPEIPKDHQSVGQVVLLPGSMGTPSFILVGAETAKETFYSTAHGSGRVSSRAKMLKGVRGEQIAKELATKGILIRAASWRVVAEEAPSAYKLSEEVALATELAGISKRVVRLYPLGVVKG
jgi:RNA-splicing ligase RtcB/intein/homing endonuclease